jgi:hypothetical protein
VVISISSGSWVADVCKGSLKFGELDRVALKEEMGSGVVSG